MPDHFTPFGVEVAQDAAAIADRSMRARGGRAIHAPAIVGLKSFDDDFFDGIIMRSYLEHEVQPKQVLSVCFEKLRPGGVIYVKVPNFDAVSRFIRGVEWCGFRFPDHVNYFNVASLKNLAEGLGYEFELKNTWSRHTNDNIHCFLTRPS